MPNARAEELRTMPDDELVTRLREAKHELFNLRFRHVTGQLDNSSRLGQLRRDIARINTLLRQREIEEAERLEAAAAAQPGAEPGVEEGVTNG